MSIDEEKFAGGVAVVTGAGAGIGMGMSRRLAAVGMTVVVTDIAAERAETVAAGIRAEGGKAEAMVVDVAQPGQIDALAEAVFARHGAVRVLINNAGIETMGHSWEISAARWNATLDINIHGVIHGCRAFIPHMLQAGKEAWIGNLASIGAFAQMPGQTAYHVTKHAVQAFSEGLYLELEMVKAPIHLSSIIPGMIKTSIFDAEAGKGEPEQAERWRRIMRELAGAHGMELDEGCAIFVRKMAENSFWVDSQPELTQQLLDARIAYLSNPGAPVLSEEARALL